MNRRVAIDRPNYRTALTACLERGDAEEGLRFCSALRIPWVAYGDVTEGIGWFDRFLEPYAEVTPGVRSRALMLRADLAFEQQDYAAAGEFAQAGLDLCRASGSKGAAGGLRALAEVSLRSGRHEDALASIDSAVEAARADGDDWEEGLALGVRAAILGRQGRLNEAQRAYEDALAVLRDNNGWGVAQVLYGFGGLARARGDHQAALVHFRNALALYREIDARPEIARCLAGVGWVALSQRDLELARSSLAESLQLSLATGQRLAVARGLEAFAVLAFARRDPARSARLAGAALALREALRHVPSARAGPRLDDLLETARRELGPAAAEALLAEGSAMSADEAVRFAPARAAARFRATRSGSPFRPRPPRHSAPGHRPR